ncbi:MAG: acyl-CoA dehydrogenase family protein [Desulfobacterales bacterium]|nr:acyl-CoA dehydrogenase family protein [Desulfobacterales bacterium]
MFAEAELGPIAHEIDRDARFPWEVVEKMRPLNFFGLQVPKEYGGADLDSISYAIAIEEISRVSGAMGLVHHRPQQRGHLSHRPFRHRGAERALRPPGLRAESASAPSV